MLNKIKVAMDITNSDIRVVSFQSNKIKKWMSSPIPAGLIKDGVIQDPQAMGVLIDTLFHSLKLKRNGIICTITGLPFVFRTINMPGTDHRVKIEAIERAARMEMSVAEEDMYLVWQSIETHENQNETDYFVVGVPRIALNPFIATLSRARVKPARIEIKPLALARAASCEDALIMSLEKEFVDIVLVYRGRIRVIHSFGNAIKPEDIFGLVNELVDGLNIAIKSFNRDFPQSALPADTPILISGHLAANAAVLQAVQEASGHPVSIINATIQIPASLPPELYAASMGLLSSHKKGSQPEKRYYDICVNLLEGLKKRKTRTIQPGYVLAASALVILLFLLFKIYDLRANARENVITQEKKIAVEAEQLGVVQKSNQEAEDLKTSNIEKYQALENELKAVQDKNRTITDLKSDYASSILSITDAFPENMDFKSISLQQNTITIEGTAKDSLDVLTFTGTLEKSDIIAEARVKMIEPLEDGGGVSFQVVIVKNQNKEKP